MAELLIVATLMPRTALHIGGMGGNRVTDDLVRRDAQGRPFIPGSAIAGPLRTALTRLAGRLDSDPCQSLRGGDKKCGCWVCELFGEVNPQKATTDDPGGRASSLWVYDAYLTAPTAIRDGVGIERATGAAARQGRVKFDLEVVASNAEFEMRIVLQPHSESDVQVRNEDLLALALAEWQSRRGTLGGRVGRGLGAFDLTRVSWYERKLDTTSQLMAFLRRKHDDFSVAATVSLRDQTKRVEDARSRFQVSSPPANRTADLASYGVARAWMQMEFTLKFTGSMLINDLVRSRRGGFDHAPWKDGIQLEDQWVLPGSSVRGVLRSQAERIARTLVTQWSSGKDEFLLRCPAGDPNNSRFADEPLANSDCLLKAAGMTGEDLDRAIPEQLDLSDRFFGSVLLGSRLRVEDGKLANKPQLKAMDFLAIDRFTGGGRDSAKFDALALWKPAFTVRLLLDNPEAWELGWLLLTLRDLHEGLATVGFGAAKGFGQAVIEDWKFNLGFLSDADFPISEKPTIETRSAVDKLLVQSATRADGMWRVLSVGDPKWDQLTPRLAIANDWVRAFHEQLRDFRRVEDKESKSAKRVPRLRKDSYFGVVDHLYPKENVNHG